MAAYKSLLNLPRFKGKAWLEVCFRGLLQPPISTIIYGLRLELDPQEWLQIDLLAKGMLEPQTIQLYSQLLCPGDTYVDVGAHVGFHALVARHHVGPTGTILAVEPQPYNCARILRNAQINSFGNVTIVVGALGAQNEFIALRDQSAFDKARLTLVDSGVNDEKAKFIVPIQTLDKVLQSLQLGRIKLAKIDVEGYELEVLRGAVESLSQIDNIVVEILPDANAEDTRQITRLLEDHEFRLFDVCGNPWTIGVECAENNIWASRLAGSTIEARDS